MGRRMPVQDPVEIKYVGAVMRHNAYTSPAGRGYYAEPGQVIQVEKSDYEAMVALPSWEKAPPKRRASKRSKN